MPEKPPIILMDATGYLFQAFHALPPLSNSKGEPTGAVYGFLKTLEKLRKNYPDSKHIVVFDAPGPTFRDTLYPDYKANRPPIANELRVQITPAQELVKALGIPCLIITGVEADDVIGTLAREAEEQGLESIICSNDKDMTQLVSDKTKILNTKTGDLMDAASVYAKYGVHPEQIIDLLTLAGDSVDNIPGVPKVGLKTAAKWLSKYHNLDNLLDHKDEIKGKVGENLSLVADDLSLSKQLVIIKRNVELPVSLDQLQLQPEEEAALNEMYQRLEYRGAKTKDSIATSYQVVDSEEKLSSCFDEMLQAGTFACYIVTTKLHYMEARLLGFSLTAKVGTAYYIPLCSDLLGLSTQLPLQTVLPKLADLLSHSKLTLVGYDLKHGMNVLSRHQLSCSASLRDVAVASYVLNTVGSRDDLASLCRAGLGTEPEEVEIFSAKSKAKIDQLEPEEVAQPAAQMADFTLRLYQTLRQELEKNPALGEIFIEMEMPLLSVLAEMEQKGVLVDGADLLRQGAVLEERLEHIRFAAWQEAGEEFNLDSPLQLQEILYSKMQLPVLRKTPKGMPSTAESVLAELALTHDLPRLIMDHRSLAKLKSTYTDKLPEQINPDTGRIHTIFSQTTTSTGRLSSSAPNLQNIPVRTPEGSLIKKAFIAPPGKRLVAADYSQIELRIMAHISSDKSLIEAFRKNQDIHQTTAAEVLGVPLDQVTHAQRRDAKSINFGLIYGMSSFGLARQLGISNAAAQQYIDTYFARYPGVQDYIDQICITGRANGYVETLFNRRLFVSNINASNRQLRQAAERAAINAPIQGTAADVIKYAMLSVQQWIKKESLDAVMVLQIHDELLFEVAEHHLDLFISGLAPQMVEIKGLELALPLAVNIGVGSNWVEAH